MRKKTKQGIARILAFILMFVTVFQTAVTDVHAVSSNDLTQMLAEAGQDTTVSGSNQTEGMLTVSGNFAAAADDVWWHMKASPTHTNAHPHTNGVKSFFAVCDEGSTITDEAFSVTFQSLNEKADSRGGFLNKYISDTEYSFVGWDQGHWFLQRNGGFYELGMAETLPDKGDEFTLSGLWNEAGQLEVTVNNITKNVEKTVIVNDESQGASVINALKDKTGRFGLRASTFGVATEFLFKNVIVGGSAYAGGWNSLYEAREGQILEPNTPAAEPKLWHMKSSSQFGNGELGSSNPAFFAVDEESLITTEDFSVTFMPTLTTNRFGFMNKYIDKDNWCYIGYNPANWYVQWPAKAGEGQNWLDIKKDNIPLPKPYDLVTMDGRWTDSGLELTVTIANDTDGSKEYKTTISAAGYSSYKAQEGKIAFRAAGWGNDPTEIYIKDVILGGKVWTGNLSVLGEAKDGLLETVDELPVDPSTITEKIWHIMSSENHRNGELGSAEPAFFVSDEKSSITDENFSVTFMPVRETNRFGFMNKYADNDHWSYIGYNTANWYVQWAGTGTNWYDIQVKDIPLPEAYDLVTLGGEWTDSGLALTVTIDNGTDTPKVYNTVINAEAFVAYKAQTGKIGFRAAGYKNSDSIDLTEVYVKNVTIGGKAWTGSLTPVGDAKGGVVEVAVAMPDRPITGEGKLWYNVKGGGGGHGYLTAGGPATAVDQKHFMPKDGVLSLRIKPDTNNNNFGVFYTIEDNNNWLYIGWDSSSHWYYQYNYKGQSSYSSLGALPDLTAGTPLDLTITVNQETLMVTVDGVSAKKPVDAFLNLMKDIDGKGRFGVMVKGTSMYFTDVCLGNENCMSSTWGLLSSSGTLSQYYASLVDVSGKVTDKETKKPIAGATVRIGEMVGITGEDGTYLLKDVEEGDHRTSASMLDYVSTAGELTILHDDEAITGVDFELLSKGSINLDNYKLIESDGMKAYVGKKFPVVLRYLDAKGDTIFVGQEAELDQVKINGTLITPVVTVDTDLKQDKLSAVDYTLAVKDEAASIDLTMKVRISVEDRNLIWKVTEITKNSGCARIATIDVPNLNFVTIDSYGTNPEFMGAKTSTDTNASGDQRITFGAGEGFKPNDTSGYLYAFISSNGYSAGLFSNSEAEGDLRVRRVNGGNEISLASAPWYYEMGDEGGQAYAAANHSGEDYYYKASELPVAKICLADDMNGDKVVNWQDGAIAYRSIMHTAMGTDMIKDTVNYRIAMNFASMAPNPYLETADNIKKVYLATDGLPQAIMLKGYGNEGHDSANSEYADIAERQGGVEDFQELIKIAHQYNTEIGIHVNAQEVYPEAASFSDTMVGKNTTGIGNGWGWLDQSHAIDKIWDLQTQARYKRFVQLYDRINGTSFYDKKWDPDNKLAGAVGESTGNLTATMEDIYKDSLTRADNMDFIYLDVWYQNSWETRRIAEEINSLGWRFSTEFSAQGEYDSTWQHWSTDVTYGGAAAKGFNSDVIRFIRNDQRDSQVINHPAFGGTADNPLLGGYHLYGFEGWGGDQNYENYIYNTFKLNLPTRFLQHYQVMNWVNYEEGQSPVGNHEKEITLKNEAGDIVVVTRVEEQRKDDEIERIITLNGRKVLYCDADEFSYLLPWTDNQDGSEKLYHWNMYNTTTEWELPDGWNVSAVNVYKLTDQGRTDKTTVAVTDGKISLTAQAGVPYVVTKAEGVKTLKAGYGEGNYVVDPGFNGYADGAKLDSEVWSGDLDSFEVLRGSRGDQYVQVDSPAKTVSASTTINGLTAGKDYVAEIYVENQSDVKAILEIVNGKETLSNYTLRSIAGNYVKCDEQHSSKMQIIQIPFVAQGTSAVFTLKREAGDGVTMWDDIRIVEKKIDNYKADGSFVQDFESVVQGLYPFVLGSAQGVSDPTTHLSERNQQYTQAGWNGRVLDDVLDGKWSVKSHGSDGGYAGIIYQTIPQNFRFEEGRMYTVSLDYQVYRDNVYAIVVGNGTSYSIPSQLLAGTGAVTTHMEFTVTGGKDGQTWIGLYSNGGNNGDGYKMGQRDFILDNLKIVEDLETVVISMEGDGNLLVGESLQLKATNSTNAKWTSDNESVAVVDENGKVKAVGEGSAVITVKNEANREAQVTITVSASQISDLTPKDAVANTANSDGLATYAIDNDPDSIWHSQWSPSRFVVNADNPAVITVDFGEEMDLTGFYFTNRGGSANGIIKKYQWAAGSQFDEEAQKITDASLSNVVEVAEDHQRNRMRNEMHFDAPLKARYLQISVIQGVGDYASIAELGGLMEEKVAQKVVLDPITAEVTVGKTVTLVPSGVEGTILVDPVWASSDEKTATVDENGVVTALKPGAVKITFTTGNGASATAVITVLKTPDKSYLQQTYDYALTLSTEGVTDTARKYFEKAKGEAKAVLDNPDATNAEIETAWDNLLDGIWGLGIYQGDKTTLKILIDKADSMIANKDKYVDEHWTELEKALDDAKDMMDNGDALDEDIKPVAEALIKAIELQRYKADKSILEELINKAGTIDESLYTPESVSLFKTALKAAEDMMANDKLSEDDQAAVDETAKNLELAMAKLEPKEDGKTLDKSKLEEQISKAGSVDESLYTAESLDVFKTALKAAKDAMNSEDQAVIDKAAKDLEAAIASLKLKDDGKGEEPSGGDDGKDDNDKDTGNGGDTSKDTGDGSSVVSPKTGDNNHLMAGVLALAVGAALICVFFRQYKRKKNS